MHKKNRISSNRSPNKKNASDLASSHPSAQKKKKKPHHSVRKPRVDKAHRLLLAFNKPYDTLSQFTDDAHRQTLADFIDIKHVYAAGRLDKDSEGLLMLTNDGILQAKITQPDSKLPKTYWVQVEGTPNERDLDKLRQGVELKDGVTLPAQVEIMSEPALWPRHPPVRFRANIPTTWLSITIVEGRNRQVRRMTAHIGFPTLRLVRYAIGEWTLDGLSPGTYRYIPTS